VGYLRDIVRRYNSFDKKKNIIVARAKFTHGIPGTRVKRVLALEVSHTWCCKRYVSRVVLPSAWRLMLTPERTVGVIFRKKMYAVRGMKAK
jgi:hypothetical protein